MNIGVVGNCLEAFVEAALLSQNHQITLYSTQSVETILSKKAEPKFVEVFKVALKSGLKVSNKSPCEKTIISYLPFEKAHTTTVLRYSMSLKKAVNLAANQQVVFCPSFAREGFLVDDFLKPFLPSLWNL